MKENNIQVSNSNIKLFTLVTSAIIAVASAAIIVGNYTNQIHTNTLAIKQIQINVENIARKTDKISTDIEWIKTVLKVNRDYMQKITSNK